MIIVDTSAVLATIFLDQTGHEGCTHALREADHRILSPFVAAEIDYFLLRYGDVETEIRFLQEVTEDIHELALFSNYDLLLARRVIEQYRSLGIGLADASIVVLAERYGTRDILTLDERHFRALRPLSGSKSFRLLPADQ